MLDLCQLKNSTLGFYSTLWLSAVSMFISLYTTHYDNMNHYAVNTIHDITVTLRYIQIIWCVCLLVCVGCVCLCVCLCVCECVCLFAWMCVFAQPLLFQFQTLLSCCSAEVQRLISFCLHAGTSFLIEVNLISP